MMGNGICGAALPNEPSFMVAALQQCPAWAEGDVSETGSLMYTSEDLGAGGVFER